MKAKIFQIFYDQPSKEKNLSGFIPIDNTKSERPDWYEFWVILNFLRNNTLQDDTFYGFLSPKFFEKTNLDSNYIFNFISNSEKFDVALFSPGWDQIAYFQNAFEQGEVWHPGLINTTQNFLKTYNYDINLNNLVSDSLSTVFSNYVIAKKEYWVQWKIIAEFLFEYFEKNYSIDIMTNYGTSIKSYPIKVFIQERLPTLVLSSCNFKVIAVDNSFSSPIFDRIFPNNLYTRKLLQTCDLMKIKYRETLDEEFIKMYWKIRSDILYFGANY